MDSSPERATVHKQECLLMYCHPFGVLSPPVCVLSPLQGYKEILRHKKKTLEGNRRKMNSIERKSSKKFAGFPLISYLCSEIG